MTRVRRVAPRFCISLVHSLSSLGRSFRLARSLSFFSLGHPFALSLALFISFSLARFKHNCYFLLFRFPMRVCFAKADTGTQFIFRKVNKHQNRAMAVNVVATVLRKTIYSRVPKYAMTTIINTRIIN